MQLACVQLVCRLFAGQTRVSANAFNQSCKDSFNRCSHKPPQDDCSLCQKQCPGNTGKKFTVQKHRVPITEEKP